MNRIFAVLLGVAALLLVACGGTTKTVTARSSSTTSAAAQSTQTTQTTITNDPLCQNGTDIQNGDPCTPAITTPNGAATTGGDTTATPPGPAVPLGRPVSLSYSSVIGGEPDTQLTLTVTKVFPIPASDYSHLSPPSPLPYRVQIRIQNESSSTDSFTDGLENDLELLSNSGQKGSPSLLPPDSGACASNAKTDNINLEPGQSLNACISVNPPAGAAPAIVRFSPQGD